MPQPRNRPTGTFASLAAHAAVLALLLLALRAPTTRPIQPESRCCVSPLYFTGPAASSLAHPQAAVRKRRTKPAPPVVAAAASAPVAPVPQQQQPLQPGAADAQPAPTLGTGTGSDDAQPALPDYFPKPGVPDRSLLPASAQNVIVEVSVSARGEVTAERLVQGLGNGVDQLVLDTVKTWRFHPATLNGSAVASVEDLVFPFSRNMPSRG